MKSSTAVFYGRVCEYLLSIDSPDASASSHREPLWAAQLDAFTANHLIACLTLLFDTFSSATQSFSTLTANEFDTFSVAGSSLSTFAASLFDTYSSPINSFSTFAGNLFDTFSSAI
jgi:hypothetical protein